MVISNLITTLKTLTGRLQNLHGSPGLNSVQLLRDHTTCRDLDFNLYTSSRHTAPRQHSTEEVFVSPDEFKSDDVTRLRLARCPSSPADL